MHARLLEHAAMQHTHLAAATGRAVPWGDFELAGRPVGIGALNVGLDGLEAGENPVAQGAEPGLGCGLLGRDVVWEFHGFCEMDRHLRSVNPSLCVFPPVA
jgi:hypothetical protein